MMLASQVFAIMSGIATDPQVQRIWKAIKDHLKDAKLKGFRLNTDLGKPYLEMGRAFGFSYGDKENGAFFSHMNVMLANALYRRGFIREGKEVIDSIYEMAAANQARIPPVLPEYFNSQGRGLYLYLTGSASWYIYTLVDQILGIRFDLGQVCLEPKLLAGDFKASAIETEFLLAGKKVKLVYKLSERPRTNQRLRIKTASFSGQNIPFTQNSCRIDPASLKSKHELSVVLTLG
jgi:cellobiose phosphorylase